MRQIQIKEITGTTADVFMEYIQRNLPEGVSMSVYQVMVVNRPLAIFFKLVFCL